MTVSRKLILGFAMVITLAIIVGLIGITGMNSLRANSQSMYENQVAGLEYASKVALAFKQMRLGTQQALVSSFLDDQKGVMDLEEQLEKNADEFRRWLNVSSRLASTDELRKFNTRLHSLFETEYLPHAREIIRESLADIPDHNNKLFINVMSASIDSVANRIENVIVGSMDYNSALAEQTSYDNAWVTQWLVLTQIILLLATIAVCATVAFLVTRGIALPIKESVAVLAEMSKGNLMVRVKGKYSGEFATVKNTLNDTAEKIKNMVLIIKNQAAALHDIVSDLAGNMNLTAASVSQIASHIQGIKGQALSQSASVSETHASMEQVVANINKLNSHIEDQGSHISQASSAIEQMAASINSVTGTLAGNAANVKALRDASEVGRTGLAEVAQDIKEIAHESEGLLEINSVMKNIASQTNLLSMNAAIEAAHAGEAGKGFAVVADEIRKLAENSGEQSKTIGNVLKKIKGSIDKISRSTGNVLGKFEAIDSSVKTVSQEEENIRSSMEEQGTGSRQILEGIGNVNEITRQVSSGSHEMLEGAKEVIEESNNLEKATIQITGGMNEIALDAEQINAAVSHVSELYDKTREGIDLLVEEVSQFKVE